MGIDERREAMKKISCDREASLCRPGGFHLTGQLLEYVEKYRSPDLHAPLRVLDIGCGEGATLAWLKEKYPGWQLSGVDPMADNGQGLIRGRAEELPFPDGSVDLVLMECSFSRITDPGKALSEILRVLTPEGKLLMSDLYIRSRKPWKHLFPLGEVDRQPTEDGKGAETVDRQPTGDGTMAGTVFRQQPAEENPLVVGRLETAEEIFLSLREAGFNVLEMQDVSSVLGDWVAQMIMDQETGLEEVLGTSPAELRRKKCGYYLCLAERSPLEEAVNYAREHSTYDGTRPGFFNGKGEKGYTDFQEIPFITAEDLQESPESFLCVSPKEIARIITLRSSGTSGKPKRLFFTAEDLERTADFFSYGIRSLVRPGDRVAVFMAGETHYSVGGLLKEGLSHLPAAVDVFGFIQDYDLAAKQASGADTLIGTPVQMLRLADRAPELSPRTVLLSADYTADSLMRRIELRWNCRVFTHWGMSETGYGGGVQCEARKAYHLRDEDLLLEIVDPETGRPAEPGNYGEIVITTLRRRGMPLIRYRTGDLGRMETTPCPCGCLKPRLDKVMGRIREQRFLPDGSSFSVQRLDEALFSLPWVLDYAAEYQEEEKRLHLTVEVTDHAWKSRNYERNIEICNDKPEDEEAEEPGCRKEWRRRIQDALYPVTKGFLSCEIQFGRILPAGGNKKRKLQTVEDKSLCV